MEGTSAAMVIYSYAPLPLLMGLAAISTGITLLIEEAGHNHLSAGALVGGCALYLLALLIAQSVVVRPAWKAMVQARLIAIAACCALVILSGFVPPLAMVAILLGVLAVMVAAEATVVRAEAA